jgi:hypothetical protein
MPTGHSTRGYRAAPHAGLVLERAAFVVAQAGFVVGEEHLADQTATDRHAKNDSPRPRRVRRRLLAFSAATSNRRPQQRDTEANPDRLLRCVADHQRPTQAG